MDFHSILNNNLKKTAFEVLKEIEENGIDSDIGLYITFKTNRSDVKIPMFLKEKYPENMTIVLQHQFENLNVNENYFKVMLAFGGEPYVLEIPLNALMQIATGDGEFGFNLIPTPENNITENKVINLSELLNQ